MKPFFYQNTNRYFLSERHDPTIADLPYLPHFYKSSRFTLVLSPRFFSPLDQLGNSNDGDPNSTLVLRFLFSRS